jgi:membrane-bound lytic murein transglycosylase D
MSRMEWIARSRSLLAAVVLLAVPLATDTMSDQDQMVPDVSEYGAVAPLPIELARYGGARSKSFLSSYRLPDTITFAGSTVPLDVWQVRERVEFEFYRFMEDEGESIILAKRTGRCFPPAERQLAEAGLPDDLKFILLVESKCISAAYSRARASGPWQFVPATGRLFSLQNNYWKDDRRNLELSTEAAVKYLKKLRDIFGDWFLAMAAYNTGEVHIRKAMREQRVDDYWKLHYNSTETMRYVPRIIASKEIFSQPEKYLGVAKADLYPPLDTEVVTVNVKEDRRHLTAVAEQFGTYFLELKLLNPEIRKDYLPRGTHQIKIPRRPDNGCSMPCEKADEPR